jgi:MinD-like ATPase involved in chromosome partitioning or flagellar assembly
MNIESAAPRVIAISGGKGGVGKTSIAINLAIALSKTGSKVCLFDGDTSLANTNVMLGLYPAYTLEHLFTGERSIQDIVITGPEGIQIVPGASGVANCVELDVEQQQRLVTSMRAIEKHYDYLLVDTAAGIGPTVLHFIAASQLAVIVITPEPTSLTDAFSLLKVLKRRGYRRGVQIVVNMATSQAQAKKTFARFSQAVLKYLSLRTEYLGSVWMDESMRNAVSTQKPVALFPKTDPSARCFYRLAEALESVFERPAMPKLAFSAYWQKVIERQPGGKRQQSEQLGSAPVSAETLHGDLEAAVLSQHSEKEWLDVRLRLNRLTADPNTTPEQIVALVSTALNGYGKRLGDTAVDLIHGLLHALDPETLSTEQTQLLLCDFERLGLDKHKAQQASQRAKARYDEKGFGDQLALVQAIRSAADDVSLDSLLESIKYASLIDSDSNA